ncbi:MAG: septum formation initiator family protein [Candidatus Kapaibacterium sp.]
MASPKTTIKEKKRSMKRRRLIIGGALSATLLGFVLFTNHGVVKRIELEMRQKTIEREIVRQRIVTDSLLRHIRILETDTLEIERLARQNYGMIKPGEVVYFIEGKK